jgi:rubrerythrin
MEVALKGTPASNKGTQKAFMCNWCGAVIATVNGRGKPAGDCPSCLKTSSWAEQFIPIAVFK